MKHLGLITLVVVSIVIGLFIGAQYQILQQEYKAEEIIGNEVALLERYKGIPDCTIVQESAGGINVEKTSDVAVVWSYISSQGTLKRMIIDQKFNTAYEEIEGYCKRS